MAERASLHVRSDPAITIDAQRLVDLGIKQLDAAHLAFAKAGGADVFLTVDYGLLRRARTIADTSLPNVANPAPWLVSLAKGDLP